MLPPPPALDSKVQKRKKDPNELLPFESIKGLTIVGAGGNVVGKVATLNIDSASWHVVSVQAKLHKDVADRLGAERSLFRTGSIDIPVRLIQAVGDAVVLTVPH
jgi:sporulation protein YlmC with PRC-barrel domain